MRGNRWFPGLVDDADVDQLLEVILEALSVSDVVNVLPSLVFEDLLIIRAGKIIGNLTRLPASWPSTLPGLATSSRAPSWLCKRI